MKKEFFLGLIVLACLPGCPGGGGDACCDPTCPPAECSEAECADSCGYADHERGIAGTYAEPGDPGSHIGVQNVELMDDEQSMRSIFDQELQKWEDELDQFAKLSEDDTFEIEHWRDPELGAPVFMAHADETMDQLSVQDAIERTVEQYEHARQEGEKVCVLCQEYAWAELDQAAAEEFAQELIAAGVPADDVKVVACVADYDHSMPPHRVEVSMLNA